MSREKDSDATPKRKDDDAESELEAKKRHQDDDDTSDDDDDDTSDDDDDDQDDDDQDDDTSDDDDDDQDDDDQDDDTSDDDDDQSDQSVPAVAPSRRKRVAKTKSSRRGQPLAVDERAVNTPSRQTLGMMGAIALSTLIMWGAGRAACNAHPAQTRKPREVSAQQLGATAKGAALEMQQRWSGYDFQGAQAFAGGDIARAIEQAAEGCEKDRATCDAKKDALKDQALATAIVLAQDAREATVRVKSLGGSTGKKTTIYKVVRNSEGWKVTGTTSAPPPPPAPPPQPDNSASPEGVAPSAGSAAPAGSN